MVTVDEANRTPRCTMRGCPVVYRSGPPRPCPMHADDAADLLTGRAAAMGVIMATQPGEHDDDSDGQAYAGEAAGGCQNGLSPAAPDQTVNRHGVPVR